VAQALRRCALNAAVTPLTVFLCALSIASRLREEFETRHLQFHAKARRKSERRKGNQNLLSGLQIDTLKAPPYDRLIMPQKSSPGGAKPAERVFLIDSMSHIFRAFYAPMANRAAPLSNSKGQVTQAVYIFTNMLRKLIQDEQPKYIAAIFESKRKNFSSRSVQRLQSQPRADARRPDFANALH